MQIQGENAVLANVQNGVATANSNVQYRGMIGSMITVAKTDGFRSLYKGLVPGIHRQLCFASIRIGLYDTVKNFYGDVLNVNLNGIQLPILGLKDRAVRDVHLMDSKQKRLDWFHQK